MAGRQAHGNAPSKKQKTKNNSKKRALDAFSIASHENPDRFKVKQHRLGAQEGGKRLGKRRRDEDDEDDEDKEDVPKKKTKAPAKGRFDELDVDEGSDSEGNEWKMGQVDSDDDSDLDSDEAFGESDEERFEGFAFSGSSEGKKKKKTQKVKDVNLDEDDQEDSDSELEEGDLGEGAVDLATMLDMAEGEEREEREAKEKKKQKRRKVEESESAEDEEDLDTEDSEDESSASSADEDDETQDPVKLAALQNMIASLPQLDQAGRPAKQRNDGASEYAVPSDFALTSSKKLTLEDLGLPTISDPNIKKSLKLLESDTKRVPGKLEVPLAKRQQDRLDRSAAYDKSKETLDRWTDTVKHNRRAEHLIFPLPDNDTKSAKMNKELVPTNLAKPFNELEATIQSILEESGLATANGKDDEDHLREFEELETNKLSIEEVKARRDQLRMARELLFREEVKAKRIKKIKSKSYRKVHRKQREKEERQNAEALAEGGFVPSEDELEAQDRRRAEERMGGKHRNSKWAKAMKGTGRTDWDEDARSGVTEMARRDEELRKRVEGRSIRKEFENQSEDSFDDSEEEYSDVDEAAQQERIRQKLDKFSDAPLVDSSLPGARLANMDFMRKADAARRKANNETVEELRRELAGEDSPSEEEELGDIGRRAFGPGKSAAQEKRSKPSKSNEFEEPLGSNEEAEVEFQGLGTSSDASSKDVSRKATPKSSKSDVRAAKPQPSADAGAWSKVTYKSNTVNDPEAKRRRHKKNAALDIGELDLSQAAMIATQPKPRKAAKKSTILEVDSDNDESNDENTVQHPFSIRDQELIKRAFAGADVVGEFETEKKQIAEDEDDKFIDNTIPGWGSWVGDGVSKREKARNKGRFLTKVEGIKAHNRKDAKLERVIINEKRSKKVCAVMTL